MEKYYTQITMQKMAQLLDLSVEVCVYTYMHLLFLGCETETLKGGEYFTNAVYLI